MLKKLISGSLSQKQKIAVKAGYHRIRLSLINSFMSYGTESLKAKLRGMGIKETDTLLVHSNSNPESGFKGAPADVANALTELVGIKGNLLMVSIPFRGSAYDHLMKGKTFHRDKTISMMGLITEIFRRKKGVLRSLHPTHPVLAFGKDSEWIVSGHEECRYPCGAGSPFDKFRQLGGKILFYDVDFGAITFFHYVEDITRDNLPFKVYDDKLFSVKAHDGKGERVIETYAFNKDIVRNARKLEDEMKKKGLVKYGRIGNSRLILADSSDVVACHTAMVAEGNFPYNL
ncbi:MAG: AAC(3) family N-acetyltransferase [Deltaproteobacteria bacterium]|nr:AAC(3) family N-acetyltransferase [Deltaproteobacteria bacterium]